MHRVSARRVRRKQHKPRRRRKPKWEDRLARARARRRPVKEQARQADTAATPTYLECGALVASAPRITTAKETKERRGNRTEENGDAICATMANKLVAEIYRKNGAGTMRRREEMGPLGGTPIDICCFRLALADDV